MHRTLTWIAGALLAFGAGPAGAMPAPFVENEPFPTIAMPSMSDGSSASIADYRGKKLILHLFASW